MHGASRKIRAHGASPQQTLTHIYINIMVEKTNSYTEREPKKTKSRRQTVQKITSKQKFL